MEELEILQGSPDDHASIRQEDGLDVCDRPRCEPAEADGDNQPAVAVSQTATCSRACAIRTGSLYSTFFAMGLSACVSGTTLVSMERLLNTATGKITWVHVISALGYTAGSILCGVVFDRMNGELQLACSCILSALTGACAPLTGNLYGYIILCGIQSVADAYINSGANPYAMRLWDKHRSKEPLMQGLHATWSVASTIGPFMIRPFLADFSNGRQGLDINVSYNANTTAQLFLSNDSTEDLKSVVFAYVATNSFLGVSGVLYAWLFIASGQSCNKQKVLEPVIDNGNDNNKDDTAANDEEKIAPKHMKRLVRASFLGLLCFYIGIYSLIEECTNLYLAPFVVKGLGWNNRSGPLIIAALLGALGIGRLLNIPISAILKPRTMLLFNISLTTLSFILMCFVKFNDVIMWISTSLAGFAMASTFPTTVLWVGAHVKMTGFVSGLMNAGGSIAGLIFPLFIGYLFDSENPMAVIYFILGNTVLHLLLFLSMNLVIMIGHHRKNDARDETVLTSLNVSE